MRFFFPYGHACPRGRLTMGEEGQAGSACLVEFSDGVTVIGTWRRAREALHLAVPDDRTAKGTQVAACNWRPARGKEGAWRAGRAP